MCGIVGFANFQRDLSVEKDLLISMNESLKKRGPDEDGYFLSPHVALAHKRLIVIDPARWQTTYDRKFRKQSIYHCI